MIMIKNDTNSLFAKQVLLATGWAENVIITWNEAGNITSITDQQRKNPAYESVDFLLPGMSNLHCHSFQRAMAGLAEISHSPRDSFWTWRDLMYRFVVKLTPKDVQIIASFTYMEMLQSGFTSIGEFHYLHQQPDGSKYDDPAEMANMVIAGAKETGIALTMLPVFYAHSDFGGADPDPHQNRFTHNLDDFQLLINKLRQQHPEIITGIAPHSLRAVTLEQLTELLRNNPNYPVHIHIAEQMTEVRSCEQHLGARPVQWLLDNYQIDDRWCLVHATHMDKNEVKQMANSGAVAGLCPITEANLGDGIFDAVEYAKANGGFGIGSDSCVRIDLADELRTLEYSQRLRDQKRVRLAPTKTSVGGHLYRQAAKGGAQALGQNNGNIAIGETASFISLDTTMPSLAERSKDAIIDGWIFASQNSPVTDVWVAGNHLIKDKAHQNQQEITANYIKCLRRLLDSN
ncbi:MAG: formimidoylglutamate deiminase [Robiginitomaculum sp.]|nr:formimidoylglutamate deiminase [Robiginitomaculum sp.]